MTATAQTRAAYPAYKASGVAWLGEVPAHWEVKQLRRLFTVVNGATPQSTEPTYWDGDIPWATPDDLGSLADEVITETGRQISQAGYENCGTTLVPAGSLVLSTRAPIGHLAIAGVAMCTNQGCRALVPAAALDNRYYYYQLLATKPELQSWGQGSTFVELSSSRLRAIRVAEPPLPEQRAIVAFLDRETAQLDALVAAKQRLIALLQEKRAALISHAVTRGLDPAAPLKDSGVAWLGQIPAHWQVKRLKHLSPFVTSGSRGWAEFYSDEGAPFIRIGNLARDRIELDLSDIRHVSPPPGAEGERTRVRPDDVLLSITAYSIYWKRRYRPQRTCRRLRKPTRGAHPSERIRSSS